MTTIEIVQRKGYVEPKTGDMIDPSVLLANGISPSTCDMFTYYIARDRATGATFGMRFATEQQAREYHDEQARVYAESLARDYPGEYA